jgi:hypothetical protein
LTSCFTTIQLHLSKKIEAQPSNVFLDVFADNAAQFAQEPQVAGQKPNGYKVYKGIYPVTHCWQALSVAAATSKKKPGLMVCSFMDGGKSISRNTPLFRLVDMIILLDRRTVQKQYRS